MTLTKDEQHQIDAAANKHCACGTKNCAQKTSFQAGVDFALQHLFAGRMEGFGEYLRKSYEPWYSQWKEYKTGETYTTDELVAKYLQHLEDQKPENAKSL